MPYDASKAAQIVARWEHRQEPDVSATTEAIAQLLKAVQAAAHGRLISSNKPMGERGVIIGTAAGEVKVVDHLGREIRVYSSREQVRVPIQYDPGVREFISEEEDPDVTGIPGQPRPRKDAVAEVLRVALESLSRVLGD